jgi:predicted amidohydrolase YtcJ
VDLDILDVTIFDGHALRPENRVSIRDGLISEIGTGAAETPAARTITATGRLLTPGFVDAHVHTTFGGQVSLACDLSRADGLDETLDTLRLYLGSTEGWVTGGGWSMADFPGGAPTASILDEVTANRPIILLSAGLRAGQSCLHRLGVTAWIDAIIGDYSGHRSPCDACVAAEISTVTNEPTVCDGRIVFDIAEGAPSTTATPNTAERPS